MAALDLRCVGTGPVEAFSVEEVAASLHVCPRTLYRAIARGELACYRIGRAVRVSEEQLSRYLQGGKVNG